MIQDQSTPRPAGGLPVWALVAVAAGVALLAGLGAYFVGRSGSAAADARLDTVLSGTAALESQVASLTAQVASAQVGLAKAQADLTAAQAAQAAAAAAAAEAAKPSFTSYCYVRKVAGPSGGVWTVTIDRFELLTGKAATDYAAAHGLTVPGNGILFDNPSTATSSYPLASGAKITASTGGAENSTVITVTPAKLKAWAAGDTGAIPNASSDMWKVTVVKGAITKLELIAIAD